MTQTILQPTLFNGITGSSNPAVDISQMLAGELSTPRPIKLKEGWYNTEKYGEVYVSPGCIAWVVQRNGNKLESVSATLSPSDIIEKSAVEKRHDAILRQAKRIKSKVSRTTSPILAPSVVSKANDGVSEVVK